MDTLRVRTLVTEEGEFLGQPISEIADTSNLGGSAENYFAYTCFFSNVVKRGLPGALPAERRLGFGIRPQRISFLEGANDYSEHGNHIPIPCFDFFLRTQVGCEKEYFLIRRGIWPMFGHWWPLGGRRLLPAFDEVPVRTVWTQIDEIMLKLWQDVRLSSASILGIQKISTSDHYHLWFADCSRKKLNQRRVTPVTSFLVDVAPEVREVLQSQGVEAMESRWFRESELIDLLACGGGDVSDHLRITLAVPLGCEFTLKEQTNLAVDAA